MQIDTHHGKRCGAMTNGASGVAEVCGDVPFGSAHGNAMHSPTQPSVFFVRNEPLKLRGSSCEENVIGTHSGQAAVVSLNQMNGCSATSPAGGTLILPPPGMTKYLNRESTMQTNTISRENSVMLHRQKYLR